METSSWDIIAVKYYIIASVRVFKIRRGKELLKLTQENGESRGCFQDTEVRVWASKPRKARGKRGWDRAASWSPVPSAYLSIHMLSFFSFQLHLFSTS